jgi:hypothetical protein
MDDQKSFQQKLKELQVPVDIQNIDFRVSRVQGNDQSGYYAMILAYKDARFDMKLLDHVMGPENWQRKHECINGTIYCSVGIRNADTGEWIWKQDAGTESQTEAEKGAASDSFKRAGFNWGIGRDLYDFPEIAIKLNADEVINGQNGKKTTSYKFRLKKFKWTVKRDQNNEIIHLSCTGLNGEERFKFVKPTNS